MAQKSIETRGNLSIVECQMAFAPRYICNFFYNLRPTALIFATFWAMLVFRSRQHRQQVQHWPAHRRTDGATSGPWVALTLLVGHHGPGPRLACIPAGLLQHLCHSGGPERQRPKVLSATVQRHNTWRRPCWHSGPNGSGFWRRSGSQRQDCVFSCQREPVVIQNWQQVRCYHYCRVSLASLDLKTWRYSHNHQNVLWIHFLKISLKILFHFLK